MTEEIAVADIVENLRFAMISGNEINLTNIVDDNLSYGHSNGYVEDKSEFVHKLVSGASNFEKIDLSEQNIRVVGAIAIVRHKFFAQTHDAGKEPAIVNLSILLIFHKTFQGWKLLARQAVRI